MTPFQSFNDKVINHFKEPRNVGVIKNADGIGYIGELSRGIDIELYIKVEDSIITEAKFKAFGCSTTIAACSVVTGLVKGKSVTEATKISAKTITEASGGLPPSKKYCAVLGQELIRLAIEDYLVKKKKG